MKNPNQINQNRNPARPAAQTKARPPQTRVRVRLRVPKPLDTAIRTGAKRAGLTISAFVERAIKEEVQGATRTPAVQLEHLAISRELESRLNDRASQMGVDRLEMAEEALRHYFGFIDRWPELAQCQPSLVGGPVVLWSAEESSFHNELLRAKIMHNLDAEAIAEHAISVYLDCAVEGDPVVRLSPEIIYRALVKPSVAAEAVVNTLLDMNIAGKMEDGISDLIGVRDLIALHPGFRNESRAISMLVDGFNGIVASNRALREGRANSAPKAKEQKLRTPFGASVIPRSWEEVAFIDFTGYLDRDCEERVIYKTPDGELKSARRCENVPEAIEDVTREQVVRWILECVIPEEFEADFSVCSRPDEFVRQTGATKAQNE